MDLAYEDHSNEDDRSNAIISLLSTEIDLIDKLKMDNEENKIGLLENIYNEAVRHLILTPFTQLSKSKLRTLSQTGVPFKDEFFDGTDGRQELI